MNIPNSGGVFFFKKGAKSWKYGPREIDKAGNLVEVNLALDQQAKLLAELRRHIGYRFLVLVVFSGISIFVNFPLAAASAEQVGGEGAQV